MGRRVHRPCFVDAHRSSVRPGWSRSCSSPRSNGTRSPQHSCSCRSRSEPCCGSCGPSSLGSIRTRSPTEMPPSAACSSRCSGSRTGSSTATSSGRRAAPVDVETPTHAARSGRAGGETVHNADPSGFPPVKDRALPHASESCFAGDQRPWERVCREGASSPSQGRRPLTQQLGGPGGGSSYAHPRQQAGPTSAPVTTSPGSVSYLSRPGPPATTSPGRSSWVCRQISSPRPP